MTMGTPLQLLHTPPAADMPRADRRRQKGWQRARRGCADICHEHAASITESEPTACAFSFRQRSFAAAEGSDYFFNELIAG